MKTTSKKKNKKQKRKWEIEWMKEERSFLEWKIFELTPVLANDHLLYK